MSRSDGASERGEGPAADSRRRGREAALQMLYQWEVGSLSMPLVRSSFWDVGQPEAGALTDRIRAFAEKLASGTAEQVAVIDPLIDAQAIHWRIERMAVVDRLILRLAVYELTHEADTPKPVVIDEALELARRYSGPEAVKFINGVLDGIRRRLEEDATGAR